MGRVDRVRAALEESKSEAIGRIAAGLKGIELTGILHTPMNALVEMATIPCATAMPGRRR